MTLTIFLKQNKCVKIRSLISSNILHTRLEYEAPRRARLDRHALLKLLNTIRISNNSAYALYAKVELRA